MNVDPKNSLSLESLQSRKWCKVARRNGQQEVEVWHLLSALINQENGIVPALLEDMGVGSAPIQLALQRELQNLPKIAGNVNTARSYASSALTEAVKKGQSISNEMQDDYVSTEHLLLGFLPLENPPHLNSFSKTLSSPKRKSGKRS